MRTNELPFPTQENEELAPVIEQFDRFMSREIDPAIDGARGRVLDKALASRLLGSLSDFGIGAGTVAHDETSTPLPFLTSGLLYENLARHSPDLAMVCFPHESATLKVARAASPSLKQRILARMCRGELIGCSAISEPGAGSNVREIGTRAVRDGDELVVSGEKLWISNVTIADLVLVLVKTAGDELSIVCVETDRPGVQRRELDMLGFDSSPFGQISFDDVRVPAENVVGTLGGGLRETMKGFERARAFAGIIALGIAGQALDRSVRFVKERTQFGEPIGVFQLVQHTIAEMATDFHAARLLVYRTLALMDRGVRCETEAAMAKSFSTEAAFRITSNAVQLHGAMGLARETGLEALFRAARMLMVPDGTTHINQLIIGRGLLGLNAFMPPASAQRHRNGS